MQTKSRQVDSNQPHLHPRLAEVVCKHLATRSRKPPTPYNLQALEQVQAFIGTSHRPLILDSFCGTGQSTRMLALANPDALVVGIDKSSERLRKQAEPLPDNALLLRAECYDLWRLLEEADVRPQSHYLLYPNPWPKSAQLKRRIHGDPAFRTLLALGGRLELRSNWQLYVEEFGVALQLAGIASVVRTLEVSEAPLTLFEAKYAASGHTLWQLQADANPRWSALSN